VNFRQLEIQGGQLYASSNKNSLTVASVGTGLPTDPGQSITNLSGNPDSGNDPYGFALFNLKGGASWDTLYVADNTAGKIYKCSTSGAVGAKWSSEGSEKVASVTGLTGTLVGSVPTLYATASGPLSNGTSVSFFQDNGDTEWYGDGLDSKDGLAQDFQKDLGVSLTYEQRYTQRQ